MTAEGYADPGESVQRRPFRVQAPSLRDPRFHVAAVLLTLQALGQSVLGFRVSIAQILVCLATGAVIDLVVSLIKDRTLLWPASGLLTGSSVGFILRVPGTTHGDWWSLHGAEIFAGVVAFAMLSKFVKWRGGHVFNPSNIALVVAFAVLGPGRAEPLDLWWAPPGPWMYLAYSVLVVGGLWVGVRIGLAGMQIAFFVTFAATMSIALGAAPDHCMVAAWYSTPLCGRALWQTLVTSPEVLLFGLFMIPDPKTVPVAASSRIAFGVLVGLSSSLLIGLTVLEFWTKVALLAGLAVASVLRFALARLTAPLDEESGDGRHRGVPGANASAAAGLALVGVALAASPVSALVATHYPDPAAALPDGRKPVVVQQLGGDPGLAAWVVGAARAALVEPGTGFPTSLASTPPSLSGVGRIWVLPEMPTVVVGDSVKAFDPTVTPEDARLRVRAAMHNLVVAAEARRSHQIGLAATVSGDDALGYFKSQIASDESQGKSVRTTFKFERGSLALFLPRYATQGSRLVGVTLEGTATLTVVDASGRTVADITEPYRRSWGLSVQPPRFLANDYTDLAPG